MTYKNTIQVIFALLMSLFFSCEKVEFKEPGEQVIIPVQLPPPPPPKKVHPPVPNSGPPSPDYVLAYAEEFDSYDTGSFESPYWTKRTGVTEFEAQWGPSDNRGENVSITGDGPTGDTLNLLFNYDEPSDTYFGGGVISNYNFGYGYYEARIKLYRSTDGTHQTFWTMGYHPLSRNITSVPPVIEKDLMPWNNQLIEIDAHEVDAGPDENVNFNPCYRTYTPEYRTAWVTNHWFHVGLDEWVVESFEWRPSVDGLHDEVQFFVNGDSVHTVYMTDHDVDFWINRPDGPHSLYGAQPVWFTLNPRSIEIKTSEEKQIIQREKGSMKVDYFRYYNKPYPGVNLLANASFECNRIERQKPERQDAFDQAPTGWIETTVDPTYDKDASRPDSTVQVHGKFSLKHGYKTREYKTNTYQNLNFIPNGKYRLSARVYVPGNKPDYSRMSVMLYGGEVKSVDISTASSTDWPTFTIDDIEVTNNRITVMFETKGDAGELVYIDNVTFKMIQN